MYEPIYWNVRAYTDKGMAATEATRLTDIAKKLWVALQEFERGHKDDMTDAELGVYFDARDDLIAQWNTMSGDPSMSLFDECEYRVVAVPLIETVRDK